MAPVEMSQQEFPVAPGPHARPDDAVVGNVALNPVAIGPVKSFQINHFLTVSLRGFH